MKCFFSNEHALWQTFERLRYTRAPLSHIAQMIFFRCTHEKSAGKLRQNNGGKLAANLTSMAGKLREIFGGKFAANSLGRLAAILKNWRESANWWHTVSESHGFVLVRFRHLTRGT